MFNYLGEWGGMTLFRAGIIDVGTNSTRLLVADVTDAGKVVPVYTDLKTTRLGEGIQGGVLLPGPVSRTVEAVREMKEKALAHSASMVVAAGTSAVRDAANSHLFLAEVYRLTGLSLRVLSGREEAFYSYAGVTSGFGELESAVITDIGGGSTEFTWKKSDDIICRSVNAGAVRMTEGGQDDAGILAIMKDVLDQVREAGMERLFGVGGTVTTLAAVDMALEVYDPALVQGYRLALENVYKIRSALISAGPLGRKKIPGLQPARADIILAGVSILIVMMDYLGMGEITVSEADMLVGLALAVAKTVDKNIG
jgi:exopolyphosphatase/guanosine-5'-triphosphate,3'-diphosphate pyrophosphatase